jgi:protein-disulfide isomerase
MQSAVKQIRKSFTRTARLSTRHRYRYRPGAPIQTAPLSLATIAPNKQPVASRTKQKEEARQRRLAEERARAEKARRERRLRMLGGVVLLAVALVAIAIAISSSGGKKTITPTSPAAQKTAATVNGLLAGIPQSGVTLGNPKAPVTVTEFGDLECPICAEFATGAEQQIITNDVKTGKVKLVYRSLETASQGSPIQNVFPTQQIAASAAGKQGKAWNYILLFYNEQGAEDTGYATESYLDALAQQIPGLNYATWKADRNDSSLAAQVTADAQAASAKHFTSTPSVVVSGPKGEQDFGTSLEDYGTYQSAINSVS